MSLARTAFSTVKRYNVILCNRFKQRRKLHSHQVEKNACPTVTIPHTGRFRYSSDCPRKCWNCNFAYKSELFCSKCKALQELPENLTYFDLMDIKQSYNVSNEEIHRRYRELQKLLHPDKFGNKPEKEKQISEKLSSLVNKAYVTLSHPLKRGMYMLRLKGVSIPEGTTSLNPEFLMEIMERNEKIEAAVNDRDELLRLTQENKELLMELSEQVGQAFGNKDTERAKELLVKMRYYDSMSNRLRKLKHDLGIVE